MAVSPAGPMTNSLTAGRLPKGTPWMVLLGSWIFFGVVFFIVQMAGCTWRSA